MSASTLAPEGEEPMLHSPLNGDANDYSRFDGIGDKSDSDDDLDESTVMNSYSVSESIQLASSSKEAGNAAFKLNQYVDARLHYETAIKYLTPHKDLREPAVTADEKSEISSLLVSLHSNNSMVFFKQENWKSSASCANQALKLDPLNVKGLFRRAQCHIKTGNIEDAKMDLQKVLDLDPSNGAARKELAELVKLIRAEQQKAKSAYSGAFGQMYVDREQEKAIRQKKLEDEKQRERDEWTQSKLRRREQGLEEQTFEQWKKAREDEKKAKEPVQSRPKKTPSRNKPASAPKKEVGSDEDGVYDEEDAKLIKETASKGYCYFRNQPNTETKELIGDITPKALSASPEEMVVVQPATASSSVAASDWNAAGTWEERDFSQLVKSRLTSICLESSFELRAGDSDDVAASATVTEVKKCDGEAQVVLTRGKKRHIYDFNVDVKFDATFGASTYHGHIVFVDVMPGSSYESTVSFKKSIPNHARDAVQGAADGLRDAIINKMKIFEVEFKSM